MQPHIDSTTDVLAIPLRASLGGFATPPHWGGTQRNPPQAIPIQTQAQRTQIQTPPLTLTTSYTSPSSTSTCPPMPSESYFRPLKQGLEPANIYDPRLPPPSVFSANINFSPTSTAGSSGAPPSMGRTTTTTTSASKNSSEMEDEPRDFAELPKTSPHFNTHLLLPFPGAARQHASTAGPGQDEQDPFQASKLSFAPIFAPVEVVPYGADRILFVEGLICEYHLVRFRSFNLSRGLFLFFFMRPLFSFFGFFFFLWQGFVTRHFATYTRVQAPEADTLTRSGVWISRRGTMTRTEVVRRLLPNAPDAPDAPGNAYSPW